MHRRIQLSPVHGSKLGDADIKMNISRLSREPQSKGRVNQKQLSAQQKGKCLLGTRLNAMLSGCIEKKLSHCVPAAPGKPSRVQTFELNAAVEQMFSGLETAGETFQVEGTSGKRSHRKGTVLGKGNGELVSVPGTEVGSRDQLEPVMREQEMKLYNTVNNYQGYRAL